MFESADLTRLAKEGKESENVSRAEDVTLMAVSADEKAKVGETPMTSGNNTMIKQNYAGEIEQKPVQRLSRKIKVKRRRKKPSMSPALFKRFFC